MVSFKNAQSVMFIVILFISMAKKPPLARIPLVKYGFLDFVGLAFYKDGINVI